MKTGTFAKTKVELLALLVDEDNSLLQAAMEPTAGCPADPAQNSHRLMN